MGVSLANFETGIIFACFHAHEKLQRNIDETVLARMLEGHLDLTSCKMKTEKILPFSILPLNYQLNASDGVLFSD